MSEFADPSDTSPAGPMDEGQQDGMGRLSVLCNPESGSVRSRLEAVRRVGRELAGGDYREAGQGGEIVEAAAAALDEGCEVLCIVGGDGTVQATLTSLARRRPDGRWPTLAVVPGGTANMIARDLGVGGSVLRRLEALRTWREGAGPGRALVRRPVLRVQRPGREVLCGMFFGAGVVAAGVRYFQRRLDGLRVTGEGVSAVAVGRVLLGLAFGGEMGKASASPVAMTVDGAFEIRARALLLLATTLDRLLLNTRPYWGDGPGPLRYTLVEEGARGLWRRLPRLVTGRPGDSLTPEEGYRSGKAGRLELNLGGPFVLDGELHEAPSEPAPLAVDASRVAAWVVP